MNRLFKNIGNLNISPSIFFSAVFILSGTIIVSALLIASVFNTNHSRSILLAQSLTSDGQNLSAEPITDTEIENTQPETTWESGPVPNVDHNIVFTSTVPKKASEPFLVQINKSESVTSVSLQAKNMSTGQQTALVEVQSGYRVPVLKMPAGDYTLVAKSKDKDNVVKITLGPQFEIVLNDIEVSGDVETEDDSHQSTTTSESIIPTPVKESLEEGSNPVTNPNLTLNIKAEEQYSDVVPVSILPNTTYNKVELYLENSARNVVFLGQARFTDGGDWKFPFQTKDHLDGRYILFARGYANGTIVSSDRKRVTIKNDIVVTAAFDSNEADQKAMIQKEEAEFLDNDRLNTETETKGSDERRLTVQDNSNTDRRILISSEERFQEKSTYKLGSRIELEQNIQTKVREILRRYERLINKHVKEYSDIVNLNGSGDLIKRTDFANTIITDLRKDELFNALPEPVINRVRIEINDILLRAEKLEISLLVLREGELTDEDFTHIDIDVPSDALVDVKSPKEFGIVRSDLLRVNEVAPVLVEDTTASTSVIYSEISGVATPNSLVTIYIFSTPVMVTVRTDADGTFRYIYEKELEDGNHEVYVALTNTEGAVLAKSNRFSFIKEAEAFTVTAEDGDGDLLVPLTTQSNENNLLYLIVLSLSLIGVGLVLLIFGIRSKKQKTEILTDRIVYS